MYSQVARQPGSQPLTWVSFFTLTSPRSMAKRLRRLRSSSLALYMRITFREKERQREAERDRERERHWVASGFEIGV